jgi:hypothetical protein
MFHFSPQETAVKSILASAQAAKQAVEQRAVSNGYLSRIEASVYSLLYLPTALFASSGFWLATSMTQSTLTNFCKSSRFILQRIFTMKAPMSYTGFASS